MTAFETAYASGWLISGSVPASGWVLVPELAAEDERAQWVAAQVEKVRAGGDAEWPDGFEDYLTTLLADSFRRRRPEDALLFQTWPTALPICVWVHVAFGEVDAADLRFEPGGVLLYDAGVGPGVQVPVVESHPEGDVYGSRYIFAGDGRALVVDVSPSPVDVLVALTPVLHSVLQALTVVHADGEPFRATPPAVPGADPADTWNASLTAS